MAISVNISFPDTLIAGKQTWTVGSNKCVMIIAGHLKSTWGLRGRKDLNTVRSFKWDEVFVVGMLYVVFLWVSNISDRPRPDQNGHVIKWKHFSCYWPFVRVTDGFPSQRPVTRSFDVFFDLRLDKRLNKHSRCRWLETPSCSLWLRCNANNLSW